MPYLMLNFEVTREETEETDENGYIRHVPTGKDHIVLRMIDTGKGHIVELEADTINTQTTEREPKWGEAHTASQVLGKGVGEQVSKTEYDRVRNEMEAYREKAISADRALKARLTDLVELQGEVKRLRNHQIEEGDETVVAVALEAHIAHLGLNGTYDEYQRAKKIFKRLTGMSWNPGGEDEDEDDSEDERDLSDELTDKDYRYLTKTFFNTGEIMHRHAYFDGKSDKTFSLLESIEKAQRGRL